MCLVGMQGNFKMRLSAHTSMLIQLCYRLIAYYLLVARVGNLSDVLLISSGFLLLYGHFYTELCSNKKCVLPALWLLFHTWTKNYDPG